MLRCHVEEEEGRHLESRTEALDPLDHAVKCRI